MPRSGSNRAEVDGTRYRYIVSASGAAPDGTVPLAVTVQLRDRNRAYLRALGLTALPVLPVPEVLPESGSGRPLDEAIKPRHVARLSRLGLARGWKPESSGPPVVLRVSNSDVFFVGGSA